MPDNRNLERLLAFAPELPGATVALNGEQQAIPTGKVARVLGPAVFLEIGRTRTDVEFSWHQAGGDEAGARVAAKTDRKINLLLDDIDVVISQYELDRQLRIPVSELREQGSEHALTKGRACRDAQLAGRLSEQVEGLLSRPLHLMERSRDAPGASGPAVAG